MRKYRIVAFMFTLAMMTVMCSCIQPVERAEINSVENGTMSWQDQYNLGIRYLSEGNYEEAIIAFTAAIEIDPKQAPAYVGRGDAYVGVAETLLSDDTQNEKSTAKYESALSDYLTAIDLNGLDSEVYMKAAEVYIALGDVESAIAILEQGYAVTGDELLSPNAVITEWAEVWAFDDLITPQELTIGGMPFYRTDIETAQAAYPGGRMGTGGLGAFYECYNLFFRQDSGCTGIGFISIFNGQRFPTEGIDHPFNPEFRDVEMGESLWSVLEKLGFSARGIQYIRDTLDKGRNGHLGKVLPAEQGINDSPYVTWQKEDSEYNDVSIFISWKVAEESWIRLWISDDYDGEVCWITIDVNERP